MIEALRKEFSFLLTWCGVLDRAVAGPRGVAEASSGHGDPSLQYFLCNTDRKNGNIAEELMRARRYAAAWEDFDHTGHMQAVKRGDIIFMYANRIGIIGIGKAVDAYEHLEFGSHGRIWDGSGGAEWRVPVDWLIWANERHAYPWMHVLPPTFQKVSDAR
jgi:hypothetical protein